MTLNRRDAAELHRRRTLTLVRQLAADAAQHNEPRLCNGLFIIIAGALCWAGIYMGVS